MIFRKGKKSKGKSVKKIHKKIKEVQKFDGLTVEESQVLQHVVTAFNIYKSLNPNQFELMEFARSLNRIERVVGMRCLRREYPKTWGMEPEQKPQATPPPPSKEDIAKITKIVKEKKLEEVKPDEKKIN